MIGSNLQHSNIIHNFWEIFGKMSAIDDEMKRKELKPSITEKEAKEILLGFGYSNVTLKELDSYDDVNHVVRNSSGGIIGTLKVHNGVETIQKSVIEAQDAIFLHLFKHGILCPQPLVEMKIIVLKSGKQHAVRLLSFLEGRTLSSLSEKESVPELYYQSGKMLGNIHKVLENFDHEGTHRQHLWDLQHSNYIAEAFVKFIGDASTRKVIESVYNRFDSIKDKLKTCKRSVIHGDFNDANIIVNGTESRVESFIDLGDSVFSYAVCDVSISLAYMTLTQFGKSKPLEACETFLKGYQEHCSLDSVELSLIPTLVACRLATSFTMGNYSYQKDPENEYLLFHAKPAYLSLENWLKMNPSFS